MSGQSERGFVFVDANTIWHRRIAEALGSIRPSIAFLPRTDARLRSEPIAEPKGKTAFSAVGLPPGWAYRTSLLAAELLFSRIRAAAQQLTDPIVVIPSPAYNALARRLRGNYPFVYYGADDYRSYGGWPAAERRERAILRHASLAVFVSDALAARAIAEGCAPQRVFVSPNATEQRFGPEGAGLNPPALAGRARPVIGVLGALSDRLDIDFLRRVADLPSVGTLLIAGAVAPEIEEREGWLRTPKVFVTGRVPHESMHVWAHAMDAALIPYAPSKLNHYCSPMRLWDHLATGVPIFALPTCPQVAQVTAPGVVIGSSEVLLAALSKASYSRNKRRPQLWHDRAEALVRAIAMESM